MSETFGSVRDRLADGLVAAFDHFAHADRPIYYAEQYALAALQAAAQIMSRESGVGSALLLLRNFADELEARVVAPAPTLQ